jgi:hypothetical protein
VHHLMRIRSAKQPKRLFRKSHLRNELIPKQIHIVKIYCKINLRAGAPLDENQKC